MDRILNNPKDVAAKIGTAVVCIILMTAILLYAMLYTPAPRIEASEPPAVEISE